jgi:opacity protein-like surface antigen
LPGRHERARRHRYFAPCAGLRDTPWFRTTAQAAKPDNGRIHDGAPQGCPHGGSKFAVVAGEVPPQRGGRLPSRRSSAMQGCVMARFRRAMSRRVLRAFRRAGLDEAFVGAQLAAFSFQHTKTGWTAGAGIENKLDLFGWFGRNWTTRTEYLYVDLGYTTDNLTYAGANETLSVKVRAHIWRALIYKFGDAQ